LGDDLVVISDELLSGCDEVLTFRGERHGKTGEELEPQLPFEIRYMPRERRLGNMKQCGGNVEIQRFRQDNRLSKSIEDRLAS
jgi:hypothetical protein